jgi:4-amino-4-deoxy-L-arabinose transferase-like glycosyltransferase
MIDPSPRAERIPSWFCGAVLALVLVLFAARNLPWHLDNYDQAKQAFTSFEMITTANWAFQHTPGGGVATKPPLAGWISAAIYRLTGSRWWEGAWRIPPFIAALLLTAILWKAARALSGSDAGAILATSAFALNVFTPRLATLVRTDMLLTLFIFLAGYLVLEKVRAAHGWTTRERWLLFAFILASILTKGPIAYAFLLPGLVAYYVCARRFTVLNYAWSGWWSWFAPLVPFAIWVALGCWMSSDFYREVVLKEFFGRFDMGENPVHKHQPVYFYIGHLLIRFVPWSLLLAAFFSVKRVRAAIRHDPALLWLLCWALGGLLVMSAVPSKRFDRIFPVVPPLCLLLVAAARHLPGRQWRNHAIERLTIRGAGSRRVHQHDLRGRGNLLRVSRESPRPRQFRSDRSTGNRGH